MSAKKSPPKTKKYPEWSGTFYNQFSCLMGNGSSVPVDEWPILPETVAACLQNLAAYEHQSDKKKIEDGPSEFAMRFISRVLREDPLAMVDAIKMQAGTPAEQLDQEAMYIARRIVVTTSTCDGEKVSFMPVKELFLAMKTCHPKLYKKIPTEKRSRAYWLIRAKLKFLPQTRKGKRISKQQADFVRCIKDGLYPTTAR